MSNDAAELLVRRYEFVDFTAALAVDVLEHLKFLVAVSKLTFKFHVTLNSILSNLYYFSGGRFSFAFVVDFETVLNA